MFAAAFRRFPRRFPARAPVRRLVARPACRLGGWALVLLAAALSGGQALAQVGGCGRCGNVPPAGVGEPQSSFDGFRTIDRPQAPRREPRAEPGGRSEARGGSYTVCVRTCDGSFFPVTYFGAASRADSLAEVCRSLCPNTEVELYSFPLGGTIDQAVSSTGQPYADAANAHKFEQSYDAACSCRRPGRSWAETLADAEAKYGHGAHDILVTPEKSAQMSRPIEDTKALVARASLLKADAATLAGGSGATPVELDTNGVDRRLSAAAASISRETSGIRDERTRGHATVRLNEGRTVEEKDPDGVARRVRIVGPTF